MESPGKWVWSWKVLEILVNDLESPGILKAMMREADTVMQVQIRKLAQILPVYTKKSLAAGALPRSP